MLKKLLCLLLCLCMALPCIVALAEDADDGEYVDYEDWDSDDGDEDLQPLSDEELLEILAEAEEDVRCGRTAPVIETFDDLRAMLQEDRK